MPPQVILRPMILVAEATRETRKIKRQADQKTKAPEGTTTPYRLWLCITYDSYAVWHFQGNLAETLVPDELYQTQGTPASHWTGVLLEESRAELKLKVPSRAGHGSSLRFFDSA